MPSLDLNGIPETSVTNKAGSEVVNEAMPPPPIDWRSSQGDDTSLPRRSLRRSESVLSTSPPDAASDEVKPTETETGKSDSSPAGSLSDSSPSSNISKSSQPEQMPLKAAVQTTPSPASTSQTPSSQSSPLTEASLSSSPPKPETVKRLKAVDQIIQCLIREAQKDDAPTAKGSIVTGKRNQLDARGDPPESIHEDLNEYRMRNAYLREGSERIGFLPQGWSEVFNPPMENSDKRPHDEMERQIDSAPKRRKLQSDYVPARHTTWKPTWLDKVQCYPVNRLGEEMSDVECLRGDELHRNADKMKLILETECMYIPSNRIDELLEIAKKNYASLKAIQAVYGNAKHPNKQVRIERYPIA
jgi:hypothetical protein